MSEPTSPQPPYETPASPGYGVPEPYAQGGYGAAAPPPDPYANAAYGYASWGQRVIASLWDFVYLWPGLIPLTLGLVLFIAGVVASGDSGTGGGLLAALGGLLVLAGFGWALWRTITNYILDQGRTGYTYGKRKVGIRTIREQDGQPAGVGSTVGRYFLHAIINQACYLDYLWPLWDPKKQTLTDKILTTVVVNQPAG